MEFLRKPERCPIFRQRAVARHLGRIIAVGGVAGPLFWISLRAIAAGSTDPFYTAKLQTARFYFARLFPETASLMRTARSGVANLLDTDAALA